MPPAGGKLTAELAHGARPPRVLSPDARLPAPGPRSRQRWDRREQSRGRDRAPGKTGGPRGQRRPGGRAGRGWPLAGWFSDVRPHLPDVGSSPPDGGRWGLGERGGRVKKCRLPVLKIVSGT